MDLVEAYESPTDSSLLKIDADVESLQDEIAASIAGCWKTVYLDPDYQLLIYGKDDPIRLQIPENGRDHAIVILGYELLNGEMTDELKGRCEAGAAVAKAYPASMLVCTGGATGENNPDQHTEAGLIRIIWCKRADWTLYNAVGAQYKKEHSYLIGMIGNYSFETEPTTDFYRMDEVMAAFQLGIVLNLPEEETAAISASLSKYMPARPTQKPE